MDFRLYFVENFARPDESQIDLVRAGAISDLEISALFQPETDRLLDRALAETDNPVNPAFAGGQVAADLS